MDNLITTIEALFCKINPEVIIQHYVGETPTSIASVIDSNRFANMLERMNIGRNKDELNAIYKFCMTEWATIPSENRTGSRNVTPDERTVIFYILLYFAKRVLLEESDIPVCEFSQLLNWRNITLLLGEDIFTTVYLANRDLKCKRERHFFSWQPIISNNNYMLKEVLQRGIVDLHFHLYASSLNFDLSWLSIMNNISSRNKDFDKIKHEKRPDYFIYGEQNLALYSLCVKAAAIRQQLFSLIISDKDHPIDEIADHQDIWRNVLRSKSDEEVAMYINDIQLINDFYKSFSGRQYDDDVVDYAIKYNPAPRNLNEENHLCSVMYGERWIMYKSFYYIFSGRKKMHSAKSLLYAYLVIKAKFRKEVMQINDYVGFLNFKEYQSRSSNFIPRNSVYERLKIKFAIHNAVYKPNFKYLEARIVPKGTVDANVNLINWIDNIVKYRFSTLTTLEKFMKWILQCDISNEYLNKYYFVYHFSKSSNRSLGSCGDRRITGIVQPRYSKLRKKVKEQALSINIIRRGSSCVKDRIVGIDAAGREIGCRPEAFAQAYRYLKRYSYESEGYFNNELPLVKLGFTYHVGEDFLDITDGLRAIDEAIRFLNLRRGDRMGHCLALGVNAIEYYKIRNRCVVLPKQDCLDNVMWLIHQTERFSINVPHALFLELQSTYRSLYLYIYGDNNLSTEREVSLETYYQSWLLRGDNPQLYFDYSRNPSEIVNITYWHRCGLNIGHDDSSVSKLENEYENARRYELARKLYHNYQFNAEAKIRGEEICEYKIPDGYEDLITQLQNKMQFSISSKHLSIEANPTSNVLIGGYTTYENHPLKRFFNLGLTYDYEKINNCPQLSVSVNTDNVGIFSTSLENEFAMLAIGMEEAMLRDNTGHSRMIYDWLDKIRVAGIEQQFKKT